MKQIIGNTNTDVLIAGAGPAGSSLAIRLAALGLNVALIEREQFPRHKLCGEFISPECLRHFDELGAGDDLLSAGGERIYETRFYDRRGRSFGVPSALFDGRGFAVSLSRFEMDRCLMERAKSLGVTVFEETKASEILADGAQITGVVIDGSRGRSVIGAKLFVDATGRAMALSKIAERQMFGRPAKSIPRPVAVGFKTHLSGTAAAPGTCEIYAFPGGYGGLTKVEKGLANLCFIVKADVVRKANGNAGELVERAVRRNVRADMCLANANPVRDWLAVSVNSFGRAPRAAAENLFTVGDAAAFIDPFTGSGMLMALESSALMARAIASGGGDTARIQNIYRSAYDRSFNNRLRVCSALRRLAFMPVLPSAAISFFSFSRWSRNRIAASTRPVHAKPG